MLTAYKGPATSSSQKLIPANKLIGLLQEEDEYIEKKLQALLAQENLLEYSANVPAGTPDTVRKKLAELKAQTESEGPADFMKFISTTYGFTAQKMVAELLEILESTVNDSHASIYTIGTRHTATVKSILTNISGIPVSEINPTALNQTALSEHRQIVEQTWPQRAENLAQTLGMPLDLVHTLKDSTKEVQFTSETISYHVGILTKKSPETLAQLSQQAVNKITLLLNKHYPASEVNSLVNTFKSLIPTTKEEIESGLAEEELKMLKDLKSYGNNFLMITVFCNNPSTFELTTPQSEALITEMQASGKNQTRIHSDKLTQTKTAVKM